MTRRDAKTKSGFVKWPEEGGVKEWINSGEGGSWVLLVIPELSVRYERDSFVHCIADCLPYLPMPDVIIGGEDFPYNRERFWPTLESQPPRDWSMPFLSVILLGTTGASWWSEVDKKQFQCTREDLTDEGKTIFDLMERLYSRRPLLLTLLDT